MTDLRVTLDSVQVPSADCNLAPSEFSENNDQCHVVLELREMGGGAYGPQDQRQIRFDRSGDSFVLSTRETGASGESLNGPENVAWFQRHGNASEILSIVRIAGSLLPAEGIARPTADERSRSFIFPLVIAQYVILEEVYFPGDPHPETYSDLAAKLLDVYANSNPEAVKGLLGKIAFFEADPKLNAEMKERVRQVLGVLGIVPLYQKFLGQWIGGAAEGLSEEEASQAISDLQTFAALAVVDIGARGRIRYDEKALDAERGFRTLHAVTKQDSAFCKALGETLGKLPSLGAQMKGDAVDECLEGLAAARLSPEEAIKYGWKAYLRSPEGLAEIQKTIERETSRANMAADWLAKRGQIEAVADSLLAEAEVVPGKEGRRSRLRLDAKAMQRALDRLFEKTKNTRHREPILAALGIFRLVFGSDSKRSDAKLLLAGEVASADLKYDREAIVKMQEEINAAFRRSVRGSELWLPLGEGAILAGGAAQLGIALGVQNLGNTPRQALGFSGSAMLGMGVGSLATHYLIPPISKKTKRPVRNRYLWDLAGGLVGGAIGAGIWSLANFAQPGGGGPGGMPTRYPVDEYGP